MAKVTELTGELRRRIGGEVVELLPAEGDRPAGVRIRGHRRRRGVFVPLDKLAYLGLQLERYRVTRGEWDRPLETLHKLARVPRAD